MSPETGTSEPLVSWSDIRDVELVIVRRMQELAMGAHPSTVYGTGHELAGLRDWQPGEHRLASVDTD